MKTKEKEDFHKGQEVYYFNEDNKEWSKVVIDEISNGFYNIRYSDGRLEMSITSTSLTKNKPPNVSPKDNYVCMVCLSSMSRKFNPLVQCSECKLYAHRECYHFESITAKSGENCLICHLCNEKRQKSVSQTSCPICLKQLSLGLCSYVLKEQIWVHSCCARYMPTLTLSTDKDTIETMENIRHERSLVLCQFCQQKGGYCLLCCADCTVTFHPLCAFQGGSIFKFIAYVCRIPSLLIVLVLSRQRSVLPLLLQSLLL